MMARLIKGQVFKETAKNGQISWRVRVTISEADGTRRAPQRSYRTRKAADAGLRQWLAELENGTAVDTTSHTVGSYLRQWLETSVQHTVRPTTLESYTDMVRVHIAPTLGTLPLQKLTPSHLQTFYSDRLAAGGRKDGKHGGLSQRTVRYLHAILHRALKEAVRLRLIPINPADDVTPPRAKRPQVPSWDAGAVRRFLDAAEGDGYGPIWLLALHTGARRGELLALRWEDLDLDRGRAQISRSLVMVANRPAIQEPKTEHGKRTIALDPDALAALREHRTCQEERRLAALTWKDEGLVFANTSGSYINPHNLDRRFVQLVETAGVPRIPFHGLRHTHATVLMQAGMNPKVVSERLGHGDIGITLSTYSHVAPGMDEQAANAFAEAIRNHGQRAVQDPSSPPDFPDGDATEPPASEPDSPE
jgi:integrase